MANSRLIMHGIDKRFGSTQALHAVDLDVRAGEIHALVGENGAGKSTLMKILSGAVAADAGRIVLDDQPYTPSGPNAARRQGVQMVYQELALAQHLDVEANVLLGLEDTRWGFLRGRRHRCRVQEALDVLQHPEIKPDSPVGQLSTGAQQLVEIARALVVDARVLILDEPTSSLTQEDAQRLFELMRRLRSRGVALIYISHFLDEIEQIADRYTVLRDGQSVGTGNMSSAERPRLIELMVGRDLTEQFPRIPHEIGAPILEVAGLCGEEQPRDIGFTLHRGEILGIAGIVGAGRTELLRTLYGLDRVRKGEIVLRGQTSTLAGPRQRIDQGMGLLSEDRKLEGLALERSIADNLTYSKLRPYSFLGWLNLRRRAEAVDGWLTKLGVRCASQEQAIGELSGGNQQKVALGRLLHQSADILLLDEPTRGVDIASKAEIYRLIGELASQGKAILFVSSYLPELLGVCDRLGVMARGRLSPIKAVAAWTPQEIMAYATQA